jgi:hypothetical protein
MLSTKQLPTTAMSMHPAPNGKQFEDKFVETLLRSPVGQGVETWRHCRGVEGSRSPRARRAASPSYTRRRNRSSTGTSRRPTPTSSSTQISPRSCRTSGSPRTGPPRGCRTSRPRSWSPMATRHWSTLPQVCRFLHPHVHDAASRA